MRHPTAQEAVADALRRLILERELRPGDPIRQEHLARRLGVSAIPVREALRVLEGEGQVVYNPRRGYAVAQLDPDELRDVYRLRELLEAEAVRSALPRLTDEHLAAIRAAAAEVEATGSLAANRRLHFLVLEAAERPVLLRHIRMLWDSTEAYRALYYADEANLQAAVAEHRELLDALEARDAEAVIANLAAHRERALGSLLG